MTDYTDEMRGRLFRNDKGDNPKRPDYRGHCEIRGVKLEIAGWLRDGPNCGQFLSLAFQVERTEGKGGGPAAEAAGEGEPETKDPLPF